MAIIKNLLVRAGADFSQLQSEMQKAQKFMQTAGKQITDIGKTLTIGITTPLVGLGATVGLMFTANLQSMSKVAAISGATGDDLEKLTEKAKRWELLQNIVLLNQLKRFNIWLWLVGKQKICWMAGISGIMNLAAA